MSLSPDYQRIRPVPCGFGFPVYALKVSAQLG